MKRAKQIFSAILMALLVFVLSGSGTYKVHAESVKPAMPELVSVANKAEGITVKWKVSENASGYNVLRKTTSTSYKRIGKVKGQNIVTYTDKTVKNEKGTKFIYTVRAYNGHNSSSFDAKGMRIIREYPSAIKLNKTNVSLGEGSSVTLKATTTSSGKVSWSSSNPDVAKVKNGKVTAMKAGKAKITAKANWKTATCTVTVTKSSYYKTLYKSFLADHDAEAGAEGDSFDHYYVFDIDGTWPPELIAVDGVSMAFYPCPKYYSQVYTIKNNKVSHVTSIFNYYTGKVTFNYSNTYHAVYSEEADFDRVGFLDDGKPSPKIIGRICHLSKLIGSELVNVYHASYDPNGYYIGVNPDSKEVGKAEYDNYFKKYFTNISRYEMLKNTPENRAKSFP